MINDFKKALQLSLYGFKAKVQMIFMIVFVIVGFVWEYFFQPVSRIRVEEALKSANVIQVDGLFWTSGYPNFYQMEALLFYI